MKLRLARPSALVDLGRIDGLDEIARDDDALRIGALVRHAAVARSELVRSDCPVLAATAGVIGDPLVRNRGTVGGSVAHADPGADYPTVLQALNGETFGYIPMKESEQIHIMMYDETNAACAKLKTPEQATADLQAKAVQFMTRRGYIR